MTEVSRNKATLRKMHPIPLAALTPSPFGPLLNGRSVTAGRNDNSDVPSVRIDEDGISARVVAVPIPEGRYSQLRWVKAGLAWLHEPLHGMLGEGTAELDGPAPRPTLEHFDLAARSTIEIVASADWFEASGDGTQLVTSDKGSLRVLPSGRKSDSSDAQDVDLARARFLADPAALRRSAFEEAGRVMRRMFWAPDMSGVDWDGVLDAYRPLLERIRGDDDFVDLMWEVFGELGTSHAYVVRAGKRPSSSMGQLGADLSRDLSGRWRVDRILPGESSDPRARSPLAAPGVGIRPGDAIVAVDGQDVDQRRGPWPLLAGTAGKPVELTIESFHQEQAQQRRVVVVPIRDQRRLRYQDWVASRRQLTRSLSEGRLGYLHIPNMMGEGWAHFSRDLKQEMRHDGLIMDIRTNSGGEISQLVVSRLVLRIFAWNVGRWQQAIPYPQDSRRGPLVALSDETTASDGDIVTAAIRSLGLGPVVGTRTWGGVSGYDEPYELIDGTRITIPGFAFSFDNFGWGVENHGVDPDVEVLNSPDDWAEGRDSQLETAVGLALKALEEQPPAAPPAVRPRLNRARPPLSPRS
jgi:tricorn protease